MKSQFKPAVFGSSTSLFLHLVALIQYQLYLSVSPIGKVFSWHFYLLLFFSALCSLRLLLAKEPQKYFMLFVVRVFVFYLIGYPLGSNVWIELTLLISLMVETGLCFSPILAAPINGALIILTIFFQKGVSAFYQNLPAADPNTLIVLGLVSLMCAIFAITVNKQWQNHRADLARMNRLNLAISRLSNANLGFQTYANTIKSESVKEERKRVSREIHDSVGYSLTNIMMMLEAATFLHKESPEKVPELLKKSHKEAKECLEETRTVMRQLRSKELEAIKGITSVKRLANAFSQVTGIHVSLDFANAPHSMGERIDRILFRFIQEGLTNAFKHGMATSISIYFWLQNKELRVHIEDNGCGMEKFEEGLGTAGMRERIEAVGGYLKRHNTENGFEIIAVLPLPGENENGYYQGIAG